MTGRAANLANANCWTALRIEQQEHFSPGEMTSSWAGAFGETQFVPSSFLRYAVDGDGDGRRDLWHSVADALASAGNLLAQSGWERGAPWGYEVTLPRSFPYQLADPDKTATITSWHDLNVRAASGAELPRSEARAGPIFPQVRTDRRLSSSTIFGPC